MVLGSVAAERLGITEVDGRTAVFLDGRTWQVVGIMDALPLAPDLDRSALVGYDAAATYLADDLAPSRLYVRADPEVVEAVADVLPSQANPEEPENVEVSRPSDALAAKAAAGDAFTSLFLGLGAVALLVGAVGTANVMVMSVLERRGEIGLRRALGATRRQVRVQFAGRVAAALARGRCHAGSGSAPWVTVGVRGGARHVVLRCRWRRWATACSPRWRSAYWPAYSRRSGRRGCRPQRRCGPRCTRRQARVR